MSDDLAWRTLANATEGARDRRWGRHGLDQLANALHEISVLAHNRDLISGDIADQWAWWLLQGLCDPQRYIENPGLTIGHVYINVRDSLRMSLNDLPPQDINELAYRVALLLWDKIVAIRARWRGTMTASIKRQLIDVCSRRPHCWYCGYAFSKVSVDSFLGGQTTQPQLARLVDIVAPRGLKRRDSRIEVDHLLPVAAGGRENFENLRLACGWCNMRKSNYAGLIEVSGAPRPFLHPSHGWILLPQAFWVIRVRGLRRRCEDARGCYATTRDTELFVDLKNRHGAWVPSNLRVVCAEHDKMVTSRFLSPKSYDAGIRGIARDFI